MNSYFASVEQQVKPELRGRPVAVVPVIAETTCCIAASYEAKAQGVRTGTRVNEARFLCPEIVFIPARTERYVHYHERIVKAVESVLPVHEVHSIDEMSCRLTGPDRELERAMSLARQVKQAIWKQAGEALHCSVGLAPNRLLAKVASDMHKPNGLTILRKAELPQALFGLQLDDLPGIGSRMLRRCHRAGIRSIEHLCNAPLPKLRDLWGGVVGERWWYWLRGEDLSEKPTQRRSIGHQHVLPPQCRTREAAFQILVKLTHKAAARLRAINYWAGAITVRVGFLGQWDWTESRRLPDVQDTCTLVSSLAEMWRQSPLHATPFKVEITLDRLKSSRSCPLPLFPEQRRRTELARAMDAVNARLGQGAVYLASMQGAEREAPDRIAFRSIPDCSPKHPAWRDTEP
ncbi:MAG: type VI secretion protein ImpB [Planctomycetaceae bacterium]|nr:type VI secretion protein ImpB [Planctomycetaceae bacterium]